MAHGEPDARTLAPGAGHARRLGQRDLQVPGAGLRRRDAPVASNHGGADRVDLLLGARGRYADGQPGLPPRTRLDLLEGSDPRRSRAGTPGYPRLRLSDRRHALGARHGAAGDWIPVRARALPAPGTSRAPVFRPLRPERTVVVRRGAVSRSAGGRPGAGGTHWPL